MPPRVAGNRLSSSVFLSDELHGNAIAEHVMEHVAAELHLDPVLFKERHLYQEGQVGSSGSVMCE